MRFNEFPVIDQIATGKNILSLRKEKGLSVKDLPEYLQGYSQIHYYSLGEHTCVILL